MMQGDSDADLLEYMSMREEDPEGARSAWGELFLRFRGRLFMHCYKAYRSSLVGDRAVEDLVHEVFKAAFESASTFSVQSDDPVVVNRQISAWLNRIAFNRVQKLREEAGRITYQCLEDPNTIPDSGPVPSEKGSLNDAAISCVLKHYQQLSDRDKEIIRCTIEWYDRESRTSRMPRGAAKELADELNTTTTNLRQVRKRFFDAVNQEVQSLNKEGSNA